MHRWQVIRVLDRRPDGRPARHNRWLSGRGSQVPVARQRVLILVASGGITFGVGALAVAQLGSGSPRRREAESGAFVGSASTDPQLFLGRASVVAGTRFMRAELLSHREGGSFSSGGYAETRNLPLIDPEKKSAQWLLPDDDHVGTETSDVVANEAHEKEGRTVATAALVKPRGSELQTARGRLLLFNPSGTTVVEVSDGVRELHVATIFGEELTVLYERDRQLVASTFDPFPLAKRAEKEISLPQLK